jgi:hypothetical protein
VLESTSGMGPPCCCLCQSTICLAAQSEVGHVACIHPSTACRTVCWVAALPTAYLGCAKAPGWVCVLCGELLRPAAGVGLGSAWARAANAVGLLLMLLGDEGLHITRKSVQMVETMKLEYHIALRQCMLLLLHAACTSLCIGSVTAC